VKGLNIPTVLEVNMQSDIRSIFNRHIHSFMM